MLTIIDNKDILFHFNQLKTAGIVPSQVKLDGVAFDPGGSVLVDGAIDLPVVGGFDVKLKLVVKLLADLRTIRIRIIDLKVSGVGTRAIVMLFLRRIVENMAVPGLRWVIDGNDGYCEYVRPQEWILMRDIVTDGDRFALVLDGVDIPLAIKEFDAANHEQLFTSPSMADKARLSNPTGART